MPPDIWAPAAACAVLVIMVGLCAAQRIPLWNPTYFFGLVFAAEIALGWAMAHVFGMQFPRTFAIPLLAAYVLMVAILFTGTVMNRRLIRDRARHQHVFHTVELTPRSQKILLGVVVAALAANLIANAIVTLRWGTLPVIAFNLYHDQVVGGIDRNTAHPGVYTGPFTVPGLSAIATHLANPAVVAYFLLVACRKASRRRPATGWRSVRPLVHLLMLGVLVNVAVVPQRHTFMIAAFTLVLLAVISGHLRTRTVAVLGVVGAALHITLGAFRRGGEQYGAAELIGLPAVAGATIVYEPAIYLGSGIPNLYIFWRRNDRHGYGELLLGPVLPRAVNRMLGFEADRLELLERLAHEGFVLPGETLRTPWFDWYYEFGWAGVLALAGGMGGLVLVLYRRTLLTGERLSVAYFVLLKPILMFGIINGVFERPIVMQAAMAGLLGTVARSSARRARRVASATAAGADGLHPA